MYVIHIFSANQLDALLEDIRNTTSCPCSKYMCDRDNRGYQIGIALVEKMDISEYVDC